MRPRNLMVLTLLLVFSTVLVAADVTGKWTAQVPGRDGTPRAQTFELKAEGDKLTGTVDSGRGEPGPIADGKVSGDTVSFTLTREFGGNTIKWTYTGTVSGNEIKFKRTGGQGEPREFTAKKAQ
ncbi:MAG: hypothetical protein JNL62_14780 [Bryobacterales bacterium]|nr:hypothetical protein [Bryobacterales bacterium]